MPLPNNLSDAEFLQDVVKKTMNGEVREWFSDVAQDDVNLDLTVARNALRYACTHQENDTMSMTLQRSLLFYVVMKKAQDLQGHIYGTPVITFQEQRVFKPQVQLYFREDIRDVDPDFSPVEGEISIRLMNQEYDTISQAEAQTLANRVKTNFAPGGGFIWKKGKVMCAYTDKKRGYQLQLLCRSAAEGKRVIEQVLDIQNHVPDWKYLNVSENQEATEAFPTLPGREMILGKSRRLPRKRPIADVRFRHAYLHIWGIPNAIPLVDLTGAAPKPLAR